LRILQRRADRGLELPTRTFADVRYGSWAAKFIKPGPTGAQRSSG